MNLNLGAGVRNEVYLYFRDQINQAGLTKMLGKKKGNVDTDIVFNIMKKIYKKEKFDKIVLVSGDGDYKMLVDFLIEEDRFKNNLFFFILLWKKS